MMKQRKPRGYWTKERINELLLERKAQGKSLQPSVVKDEDNLLYQHALRSVNGMKWGQVLKDIGEGIESYKLTNIKERKYKNTSDIISAMKKRKEEGKPLDISTVTKEDVTLVNRSREYEMKWNDLLEAVGEDPRTYKSRGSKGYWDKERVVEELERRKSAGENMTASVLHKEDISLYRAIRKYYKDVSETLKKYQ